jgi:hypothetical protein
MSSFPLAPEQKELLRTLQAGLEDGTVNEEWNIMWGSEHPVAIVGLKGDLQEIWKQKVRRSDFVAFERAGLFTEGSGGAPKQVYVLFKQAILDLLMSDFGEKTSQERSYAPSSRLIFVSHSHSDSKIAKCLVEFLLSSLEISEKEIRCTSVPGFQLPFGKSISEQLKSDVFSSITIVALLTENSLKSTWVLFELGASWALEKLIIPILGPGLPCDDLPGPLKDFPAVEINKPDATVRLRDAVVEIAKVSGVEEKSGGWAQTKLEEFVIAFRGT